MPVTQDEGRRLQGLLARAEQIGQIGSWEFVVPDQELFWSDNLYRIFGVEPGAIEPTVGYILAQTHPDDRERLNEAVTAYAERGERGSVEFRITRPNADRRHLRATLSVVERQESRPHRVIGVLQDVTDYRRAEREIAAHVAVQETLVAWEGLELGAHRLMADLGVALDCVTGEFWVPRGDILLRRVSWRESGAAPAIVPASARALRSESALAVRAWEARKPLSWTLGGAAHDGELPSDGLSGAIAIPALVGDEVLAIIEFRTDREIRVGERLLRSLYGISHEVGQFLARRRGELAVALLTPREIEMLQLAALGLSARETAEQLVVSAATVRTHLENIYRKMEVSDKPSAVATALRLGLIV